MRILFAFVMALGLAQPLLAAELGDDGLNVEPWIRDTFKDLAEDHAEAVDEGKRMAIFVEQRGCVYCKKMHEEVYSTDLMREMIEENYYVIRINLHGDTEVTDFDGEAMSEKAVARKWGVLFTPTVLFMPEEVTDAPAIQQAVSVMPGAFALGTTQDMYTWVLEKRYDMEEETGEDFQRYHARRIQERSNGSTD